MRHSLVRYALARITISLVNSSRFSTFIVMTSFFTGRFEMLIKLSKLDNAKIKQACQKVARQAAYQEYLASRDERPNQSEHQAPLLWVSW